ncbi:hypothetical protein MKI84_06195 [Ancylobacter sp. A5.8]|uniref:hypothetical protein n=1 Tax=Ancylobacter gelatini TaxID=2919920 RepID=UPI001F4D6CB1|nr:hypothetical protein [Ancylobacter gelatini]MCJ8142502.1 hypothetical protein [Ancylobacter gelatini]
MLDRASPSALRHSNDHLRDSQRLSLEFTIVLLKDSGGRVTGMASVLRDVTKRFEEMRALKKELARLEERLPGP